MRINGERSKILVVDDEKINIDVLVGLLKPHYQVIIAKNGDQALRRLEKPQLPDLILLDIMMPGLDGYQVCRKIKNNPLTTHIPVIFITGKSDVEDEAMGFRAGAVDYITKPFSSLIVMARVKTHVELKRRGDMLEQLAGLDGLTSVANRRNFDQALDAEWKRSIRHHHHLGLIISDIDFFKNFNDHYGHTDGDECLKKVASAIKRAMPRDEDLAARFGGEEFACILPETDKDGALIVAERIRANVNGLGIPHCRSKVADHITVSIGAASTTPRTDHHAIKLVEMADKALYQAKRGGRNQICGYQA